MYIAERQKIDAPFSFSGRKDIIHECSYTGLIGQMTTKARHFGEAYLASIEHEDQINLSIAQQDMVVEVPYLSFGHNGLCFQGGDVKLVAFSFPS